jgi:carboxylesterase
MPIAGLALALVALGGLLATFRYLRTARMARELHERLPISDDGIIPGAQSIRHDRSATHAALLIHGFGDTPQTLAGLATHLADVHGWTVHAPLLPGHGRTLEAFRSSRPDDWTRAVHDALTALRASHTTVVLVGLSFGAALSVIEAAQVGDVPAMALIAPYLMPTAAAERLAPLARVMELVVPWFEASDGGRAILDPDAREQSRGYGTVSPMLVRSLVETTHDAAMKAALVTSPVLLLHSTNDYRVPLHLADRHRALFTSAASVTQERFTQSGHVLTVDRDRAAVWRTTASWLAAQVGAPR